MLRIVGLRQEHAFHKDHRVLSHVPWSARLGTRIRLHQLVAVFAPEEPVVLDLEETLERRWGPRIGALGLYRAAGRSSRDYFVNCRGLRWMSVCLLVPLRCLGLGALGPCPS